MEGKVVDLGSGLNQSQQPKPARDEMRAGEKRAKAPFETEPDWT
jgi:hypothetical protein